MLVAFAALPAAANAATRTWDGEGPGGQWSSPENWEGDVVPADGDDVILKTTAGTDPTNYDLPAGIALASVTFVDGADSHPLFIGGDPIPLAATGQIVNEQDDTGDVALASGVDLAGGGSITQSGGDNLNVHGVSGNGPLRLDSTGFLALRDTSTYTGPTSITGTGVVMIERDGSVPPDSAVTVDGTAEFLGFFDPDAGFDIGSLAGSGKVVALEANLRVGGNGDDTTFSGSIEDGGFPAAVPLTKTGPGTLTLTGANTYIGLTVVDAGTLAVNGSLNSSGGGVLVSAGGTLAGTGTVGDLGALGTVAPGNSVGTLHTGDVVMSAGSPHYSIEIDSGGADRLDATGTVDVGAATLDLTLLPGYANTGATYTIVANDGSDPVAGTFAGLPQGAILSVDGNRFRISYAGGDGNDVTLTAVLSPTLTADASGDVELGGQVHDTATLAGGGAPTGQIAFRLYGPGDPGCSGTPVFTDTKAVAGNGSYSSQSFTPTEPGSYRWVASYSGDAGNDPVAGACGDADQSVTVTSPPDPPDPPITPTLEITGVELDRERGTATLTIAANVPGQVHIAKSNKVKANGPATVEDGTAELEVIPRNKAARKLERKGRLTVNPKAILNPAAGGELLARREIELRQD